MSVHVDVSRRAILSAAGATIALPMFESLRLPAMAAAKSATPPKRMIFLGMGFGVTKESWFPDAKQTGEGYTLSPGLKPLERHKKDITVIQNLMHQYSDGGHWGSTFYLTGANRYAMPGSNFHNTVSVDQVAAEALGEQTRFNSLQLGFDTSKGSDGHGPGLSLAWNRQGKPMAGHDNPMLAYNRLFGDDKTPIEQKQALLEQKRSALDAVVADAKSVGNALNAADKAKLEEYLQSIRDIETRLAKEEKWMSRPKPAAPVGPPDPTLEGLEEIRIMYDLIVAALQTDSTRVITYRQPITTLLQSLGFSIGAHPVSHYKQGRIEISQKRDEVQSELLAGLIDKLKSLRETDGSALFDNTILTYGSNISSEHLLNNCPMVVAGGGGENIRHGRHIVMPHGTPLCNLWLTLLHSIGIRDTSFGDSTGPLEEIYG